MVLSAPLAYCYHQVHTRRVAELLTLRELAQLAGLTYGSMRTLYGRCNDRYRQGDRLAWDLPRPHKYIESSPVWTEQQAMAWLKARAEHSKGRRPRRSKKTA